MLLYKVVSTLILRFLLLVLGIILVPDKMGVEIIFNNF